MAVVISLPLCLHLFLSASFPSSHQASSTHATSMQMHLAQVMGGREPPSEYVASGMETHPSAGRFRSSGFPFIPTLSLVLEAKPLRAFSPRVWKHVN